MINARSLFLASQNRLFTLFLLLVLLSHESHGDAVSDSATLLEMHNRILNAFVSGDAGLLLDGVEGHYFVATLGAITHFDKAKSIQDMQEHFDHYQYEIFKDVIPPVVKISKDKTLGWVLANVKKVGAKKPNHGQPGAAFSELATWVELYEKKGGRWVVLGSVTSSMSE